jgi:broad specificity phosphatase PhoE
VIYLCRHGETEWNRAHRLQGQCESDLTPLGRAQAGAMGDLLRDLIQRDASQSWRIVASPRCSPTAPGSSPRPVARPTTM